MVRLAVLPELGIISGFKGVIDFYTIMGIPCARRWPRKPAGPRAPAVAAAGATFADFARRVPNTAAILIAESLAAIPPGTWTWKDIWTRAAYGHLMTWD